MRVYIGPYKNFFGPHQIADCLMFWCKDKPFSNKESRLDYKIHEWLGDFLAHGFKGSDHETLLYKFLLWIDSKRKRKIKIKIHKYDTWNMDYTLSPIILPMLIQLKKTKHGSGIVDLEDVPDHLRAVTTEHWEDQLNFPFYTKEYLSDVDLHTRYEWVLDEMIWAFEQLSDPDNEEKFFTKKDPIKIDKLGLENHWKRIENGLRLFGKYYRTLWD